MSLPFETTNLKSTPARSGILNHLIELGTYGLFPLFDPGEIPNLKPADLEGGTSVSKLTQLEKKLQKIYKKVSVHKNIERQKIALMNLSEKERNDFTDLFLKMVEARLLNRSTTLH